MKKVLSKLINPDQTGYLPGRYIGENIRTVLDIDHYLTSQNKSALMMQIDFEKAFDTTRWKFIDKALQKFNFGCDFRNWVNVLYADSKSAVMNKGHFSEYFKLERGVRQGCPLSVYLFLLVAELLANKIRSDEKIEGIKLKSNILKVSQMADDTNIFINCKKSVIPLFDTLHMFALCSGLKTNVEKTKIYMLGHKYDIMLPLQLSIDTEPIRLLGLTLTNDAKFSSCRKYSNKTVEDA